MLQALFIHSTNIHCTPTCIHLIAITILMLQHSVMYAAICINLDVDMYVDKDVYLHICI